MNSRSGSRQDFFGGKPIMIEADDQCTEFINSW